MAANNRGNMRPTNRSPPFLAIGLFVALVILGFNYWNLSVKNGEQFNEISVMERELKIVSAKKTSVEKRADAIQDKVKYLEEELTKQKGYVSEKAAALASAQNERESAVQGKAELQTEFDLMKEKVPLCQKEVESLKQTLDETKAELERKKNEQPPTQTCGSSECAQFVEAARDNVLDEVLQFAGSAPLITLYKNGRNVGKFSEQLKGVLANQQNVPVQGQQQYPGAAQLAGQNLNLQQQNVQAQGQQNEMKQEGQVGQNAEQLMQDKQVQPPNDQPIGANPQPQVPAGQVAAPVLGGDDTRKEENPVENIKKEEKETHDDGDKDEEKQPDGDNENDVKDDDKDKLDDKPGNDDVDVKKDKVSGQVDDPHAVAADDHDADAVVDDKADGAVAGDDDGDYEDENDDRLKVGDNDKEGDDYNYDDDDDQDNEDGEADNYDDENDKDMALNTDNGIEKMQMQMEKDDQK